MPSLRLQSQLLKKREQQQVQLRKKKKKACQALLVDRLCDTVMCNAGLEQGA